MVQLLTRRALASGVALFLGTSVPAFGDGMDEVRKAASVLPGYGPPDLAYPAEFQGRWRVTRDVVDVQTPLGAEAAPARELKRALNAKAAQASAYDARFIELEDGRIVADRAFNAEQREAALLGPEPEPLTARWEPSNPNILTVSYARSGQVVETKVTKRSSESPQPGAFGTSEYARIADAGSSGPMGGVPSILARRLQARYRWDPGPGLQRFEALELEEIYDPTQTGFADLAGATPVVKSKARLVYTR